MFELESSPDSATVSHFAFTGNPIWMVDANRHMNQPVTGYPYKIYMGNELIYAGRFNYPCRINISGIVDAFVSDIPEPRPSMRRFGPMILVEDARTMAEREVYARFDGETERSIGFIAIPGGISKQNLRQLGDPFVDRDIFTERFLCPYANCFLTTRTAGWRVTIKETELFPLYLIVDTAGDKFRFVEKVSGKEWKVTNLNPGIYALDVDALRQYFFDNYGVLSSVFDIYHRSDDAYACQIAIEQSLPSKERYIAKFRNSLGVFELVEIPGEMREEPTWKDSETSAYSSYESIVDDFSSRRDRLSRTVRLTVETTPKRPNDVRFLMDMAGSEEVYLLGLSDLPLRVIPSMDKLTCKIRPSSPEPVKLAFDLVDAESMIMQDIIDGSESRKPRIFSKQFTEHFN